MSPVRMSARRYSKEIVRVLGGRASETEKENERERDKRAAAVAAASLLAVSPDAFYIRLVCSRAPLIPQFISPSPGRHSSRLNNVAFFHGIIDSSCIYKAKNDAGFFERRLLLPVECAFLFFFFFGEPRCLLNYVKGQREVRIIVAPEVRAFFGRNEKDDCQSVPRWFRRFFRARCM